MARKSKEAPADAPVQSILEHLAAQNPPPVVEQKPEVDVAALLTQIASLNERAERYERTNAALMATPPASQYQYPAQPAYNTASPVPQAQFGPLPDPVMDEVGFNKALSDRIAATVGAALQAQNQIQAQQAAQEGQVDHLWNQFEAKYPELAKHKKLVGVSASDIAQEMRMRGIDMNRYMNVASEQFLDEVANRMKKDFGPMVDPEEVDEKLLPTRQAIQRTAGVFGGVDSGGKPAAPAEAQPGSMVKDLQDLQIKSGYY